MTDETLLSTDEFLARAREATRHLSFNGRIDTDLTERTLRYYLSMKYLSPSLHRGGRRAWTEGHLAELIEIRTALSAGKSLRDFSNGMPTGTKSSWRDSNQGARRISGSMRGSVRESDVYGGSAPLVAGEEVRPRVSASEGWSIALAKDVFISGFTPDEPNQPELEKVVAALSRILTPDDKKEAAQ